MPTSEETNSIANEPARAEIEALLPKVVAHAPSEAVEVLSSYPDDFIGKMLTLLNPGQAQDVLERFPIERRQKIVAAAPAETRNQWIRNEGYPETSIGHMMEPALAVFQPGTTIADAARELRHFVKAAFITYVFVIDKSERLVGVVAMREMLLARHDQRLEEVMVSNPFYLTPEMPIVDAMKATMLRHYPVYPVCDRNGKLIGLIRGQMLFEAETVELSLQAGTMVGVEKEERLTTPWPRSFRYRHPWLQGNLLLGFLAAAVVGYFEETIDHLVALAVFLPVLIGQSVNTGMSDPRRGLARHDPGRIESRRRTQRRHQRDAARFAERRPHRCDRGDWHVPFCLNAAQSRCLQTGRGGVFGHGHQLFDQRHFRSVDSNHHAKSRHRPRDRFQHHSDHHYRREHASGLSRISFLAGVIN